MQGFTTKADGHRLGLHTSALAAQDRGGTLTCTTDGPGTDATFLLEPPLSGLRSRYRRWGDARVAQAFKYRMIVSISSIP